MIFNVKNDLDNMYFLVLDDNETARHCLRTVISTLYDIKITSNDYTRYRWQGLYVSVLTIPRIYNFHITFPVPTQNFGTIAISNRPAIINLLGTSISAIPDNEFKVNWRIGHKLCCAVTRKNVFTWLLVANRLDLNFPLEITSIILTYVVSDNIECLADKSAMIPLRGPNVYSVEWIPFTFN